MAGADQRLRGGGVALSVTEPVCRATFVNRAVEACQKLSVEADWRRSRALPREHAEETSYAMKPGKINLPDVALCAVDSANMELTLRAMERCMERCSFGDVFVATDLHVDVPFRVEKIEPLRSRNEYSKFAVKNLGRYSDAPYFLLVQWDGYVLNPGVWTKEFLNYDYIGAKWSWFADGGTVGNGGFSLRSKKLLDVLALPEITSPGEVSEDVYICRILGPMLESQYGIRFAHESVADLFSYERSLPECPTFGFHGLFNMWRHMDDTEMADIAGKVADYVVRGREYAEIIAQYYAMRKFDVLSSYYKRLRNTFTSTNHVRRHLRTFLNDDRFVTACVRTCESLVKPQSSTFAQIPARP
jgi:hypothetical protein